MISKSHSGVHSSVSIGQQCTLTQQTVYLSIHCSQTVCSLFEMSFVSVLGSCFTLAVEGYMFLTMLG